MLKLTDMFRVCRLVFRVNPLSETGLNASIFHQPTSYFLILPS